MESLRRGLRDSNGVHGQQMTRDYINAYRAARPFPVNEETEPKRHDAARNLLKKWSKK